MHQNIAVWQGLVPSAEQTELTTSARRHFATRFPLSRIRTLFDEPAAPDWAEILSAGYPLIGVPEPVGAGELADLAALLEEAGRALLPVPLLATTVALQTEIAAGLPVTEESAEFPAALTVLPTRTVDAPDSSSRSPLPAEAAVSAESSRSPAAGPVTSLLRPPAVGSAESLLRSRAVGAAEWSLRSPAVGAAEWSLRSPAVDAATSSQRSPAAADAVDAAVSSQRSQVAAEALGATVLSSRSPVVAEAPGASASPPRSSAAAQAAGATASPEGSPVAGRAASTVTVSALPVLDGAAARHLTLLIPDGRETVLAKIKLTRAGGPRATPEVLTHLDPSRPLAVFDLVGVPARTHRIESTVDDLLRRARVAVAADLVGTAAGALDHAVRHALDREQFGRPIGAFQAVKHRLANVYLAVERARSLTAAAALTVADPAADPVESRVLPLLAKAAATEAALSATDAFVQILGAMGVTFEADAHLYFRRARQTAPFLGTPDECYRHAATLRGGAA